MIKSSHNSFPLKFQSFLGLGILLFFVLPLSSQAALITNTGEIGHYDGDGNQIYDAGAGLVPSSQGLNNPTGSCINTHTHQLFVGDTSNKRIMVFPLDSTNAPMTTKAAYVLGQATINDQASTVPPVSASNMTSVGFDVECDSVNDRLFVADAGNNRVMVFDVSAGNIANNENATYFIGQTSSTGNLAATTQNGLNTPLGLAYDSTNARLFVSDTLNNRVLIFSVPTGTNLTNKNADYLIGASDFTTLNDGSIVSAALLSFPTGMDYDSANTRLFVADTNNSRVLVFSVPTATNLTGISSTIFLGQSSSSGSSTGVAANRMNSATDVAWDSGGGRLFVNDTSNNRVLVFTTIATNQSAAFVLGQSGFNLKPTGLSQSGLFISASSRSGITFAAASSLVYVTDYSNSRVMVFSTASITNGENASYEYGHAGTTDNPIYTAGYSNNHANSRSLYNPHTAVVDATNHRMFISEFGDHSSTDAARVVVVPLDSTNHISSNSTGIATHVLGWTDFYTNPGIGSVVANNFGQNTGGVAYDSTNQRLFVADTNNNRVMVFDASNITDNENATYFIGQVSNSAHVAATTSSGLNKPMALEYDSVNQRLFVDDSNNNRIMIFNVPTGSSLTNITAVAILGQSDYTTATAHTTQTGLSIAYGTGSGTPSGMSYDSTNNRLFVPDTRNNRIMVFNVNPSTLSTAAINELGQSDYVTATSHTTQAGFNSPQSATYDSANTRLFVADTNNSRVLVFNVATSSISNGENAQAVIAQNGFTTATPHFAGLDGNGASINGSFDSTLNTYFDVQYAPDRVVQFPMIHLTTVSLPSVNVGTAYSQPIAISQNQGTSQSYSLYSGTLPTGLTLNSSTGVISGTATQATTANITIEADDNFSDTSVFFDRVALSLTTTAVTPSAPTIGTAIAGTLSATISFTPGATGGATPTYTVTSSPGNIIATGTSSPITISGLTAATSYTFTVIATNSAGTSSASSPSNAIIPSAAGSGGLALGGTTSSTPTTSTPFSTTSTIVINPPSTTVSTTPIVIPNCNNTTGFSTSTGQSCITNTGGDTRNPSTSSGTSNSSTNTYNFGVVTLAQGSAGNAVKELQRFLNNAYNLTLTIDGKLGPKTILIVKKWQKDHGLKADGIVGPKTKALMKSSAR
jgi:DNA-binding beta-propeller fold protein YncE